MRSAKASPSAPEVAVSQFMSMDITLGISPIRATQNGGYHNDTESKTVCSGVIFKHHKELESMDLPRLPDAPDKLIKKFGEEAP